MEIVFNIREGQVNMKVEFIFIMKPWHEKTLINKSGMPTTNNSLKPFPNILYLYICHLTALIDNIDKQSRHNYKWWYKWHNLTLWKLLLHFYVSSYKISLMLKHRYYYFRIISNKRLCYCTRHIIHAFLPLFFEGFI